MIDKTKINFKKGVACLLATLQVGIVSGCSLQTYKEAYNEAVATIEKLESEKESLQDELNKGSIYEDKYNEALAKIEQLEGENTALQDKLNQKDGKEKECQKYIDVIKNNTPSNNKEDNNLDNELATKLGIDESILANPDVQNGLKKLADYLNKQPNIKDDNFADTHQIFFYSDGSLKGQIHFSDTTRSFDITLYYEDYFESITVSLYENLNTNYISGDKTWNFENNIYYLSDITHTDGKNDYKEIGKDTEDSTLSIILVDSDTPHINIQKFIFADNQMVDKGLWSYNINTEDYQTLNNLIDSYKNSNEFGDIVDYIKDALLNSLEKELSEEKYVEIKNVLENEKVLVIGK